MMRNIFKFLAIFATVVAFTSCKSDDARFKEDLVGDWHYAAEENGKVIDIWLSFSADDTFKLYQLVGEGAYWSSTGKYSYDLEKGIISGRYSDQTPWAHDYKFDVKSTTLTLTAVDVPSYVVKYNRENVPSSVVEKSLPLTKSSGVEFIPFL